MNLRTLPVVLTLLLAAAACTEKAKSSDFVVLAQRAYPGSGPLNREAMDDLWSSLFRLPQWHFLMTPASAVTNQPAVQLIGTQGWLLAFTDTDKLKRYATTQSTFGDGGVSFLAAGDGGSPLILSMTPEAATSFLAGYPNPTVAGVRFNEGAGAGWFAPLKSIGDIRGHLKSEGKLDPLR